MSRLAVVFGSGSVTIGEMLMGLDFCTELIFVLAGDSPTAEYASVLSSAGPVLMFTGDPTEVAAELRAMRPDGIVTFSESMLAVTARLATAVGLPFHSLETIERLTDKSVQRRTMRKHGIDTPTFWLLRDDKDWPHITCFPVVVKPARGEGGRNTYLVNDPAEGFELVKRLFDSSAEECLVVEEALAGALLDPFGDYVSVESFCTDTQIQTIGVTGKFPLLPPFREAGQFIPDALSDSLRTQVVALASRTLRALDVRHGITHTEIKLTEQGPRVIEVNGRLGGFLNDLYQRACGLDLVEMAGRLALGLDIGRPIPQPGKVVFQHCSRPPLEATRLLAVDGARALAQRPGVVGRLEMVKPGSPLPDDRSRSFLDSTVGNATSHQEMFAILDDFLARIRYTFETATGPISLSGNELRSGHQTLGVR